MLLLQGLMISVVRGFDIGEETLNLTVENFDEIMDQQGYTLVAMIAPWCRFCKQFQTAFTELEQILYLDDEVDVGYVDLQKNDDLHERFKIRHLPSLFLFY